MTIIFCISTWYLIGVLTVLYAFVKDKKTLTYGELFVSLIAGIFGPILALLYALEVVIENKNDKLF